MSNTLDSAAALIQLQAALRDQIIELSLHLGRRSEIKATETMCDVRRYGDRIVFEVCVDAKTTSTAVISFWLEFGCEGDRWHVEALIRRNLYEFQEGLEEYPEASPAGLEELKMAATQACDWLVGRAKSFDFTDPA